MDILTSEIITVECAVVDLSTNYKKNRLCYLKNNLNFLKNSIRTLEATILDAFEETLPMSLIDAYEGDKRPIIALNEYVALLKSELIMVQRERRRGHTPPTAYLVQLSSIDTKNSLTSYINEIATVSEKLYVKITTNCNDYMGISEVLETLKHSVFNLESYIACLLEYQKLVDTVQRLLAGTKPLSKHILNSIYSTLSGEEERIVMLEALTIYNWEPAWVERYLANSILDYSLMKRLLDVTASSLSENSIKRHLKYLESLPRY